MFQKCKIFAFRDAMSLLHFCSILVEEAMRIPFRHVEGHGREVLERVAGEKNFSFLKIRKIGARIVRATVRDQKHEKNMFKQCF